MFFSYPFDIFITFLLHTDALLFILIIGKQIQQVIYYAILSDTLSHAVPLNV